MGRAQWLRAVAALWLLAGTAGVGLLLYTRSPVRCDCPSPPCHTRPGGPRCDLLVTQHPYVWLGVVILVVAVVGTIVLWRLATKLTRTVAEA